MFILPLLLILFVSTQAIQAKETPTIVVALTRHGAREPLDSPYDTSWKNPASIMDVGIEQHYALGTFLAKRYSDLLQDINPWEIYVQSTYTARAQMSISAQLLGIFTEHSHKHLPTGDKKDFLFPYFDQAVVDRVVDDIMKNQTMIPNRLQFLVQTIRTREEEDLVQVGPHNCKYVLKNQDERIEDAENKKIQYFLKDTFAELKTLGYNVTNMREIKWLGDALQSRYMDNKPPLKGIPYDGRIYNDTVFALKWWNVYNLMGDEYGRALKIFPLYDRLVQWFTGTLDNEGVPIKLALLGGHESSMFPFLQLYNITNHTCFAENYKSQRANKPIPFPECEMPEMASQIIWEFYNNTRNPYIKMIYNGKQHKLCRNSEGLDCSLREFAEELPLVTSNLTPSKWLGTCTSISKKAMLEVLLIVTMCSLGLILVLLFYLCLSKKIVFANKYMVAIPNEHGDNEVLKSGDQATFETIPSNQPGDLAV